MAEAVTGFALAQVQKRRLELKIAFSVRLLLFQVSDSCHDVHAAAFVGGLGIAIRGNDDPSFVDNAQKSEKSCELIRNVICQAFAKRPLKLEIICFHTILFPKVYLRLFNPTVFT